MPVTPEQTKAYDVAEMVAAEAEHANDAAKAVYSAALTAFAKAEADLAKAKTTLTATDRERRAARAAADKAAKVYWDAYNKR